ncbi:MAG: M20 family metallopeptidase [Trueperaceae bacterium]|nr:M20 family metallopeptidase [Trueperaceae bacterium]
MPDVDALAARARDAVDAEAVLRRTVELVRVRSVWDPETGADEAAAAAYVADELRALGLSVTVDEVAPGRPNVVADWTGAAFEPGSHRTLMLEGHTDVVTEGDRERWSRDPYGADLEPDPAGGARLYGRGSADMKAGVAAAIEAVAALRRAAPDLPGRVRLGIVVDEEGMMLGIKRFVAGGWADEVDGAIVCEPEELELCLHQKGAMRLHVHVRGVMAHGAMPYAGVNPIAGLQRLLAAVETLQDEEQARLGAHPFLGFPWLTPTIVRSPVAGEAQLNVMPDTAYAALDVRTVPGQSHEALFARLRAEADRVQAGMPNLAIELDWFESRPWTETAADDPLVRALEAAYPTAVGGPPRYGGVPGATDGTFLHAAGVPIVTVGPGDRTIPHQVDEFVRVDDVVRAARLYAEAAVRYLMAPPPVDGPRAARRRT